MSTISNIDLVYITNAGLHFHPAYINMKSWARSRIFCEPVPENNLSFRAGIDALIAECGGYTEWRWEIGDLLATFDKPEDLAYFLLKWS